MYDNIQAHRVTFVSCVLKCLNAVDIIFIFIIFLRHFLSVYSVYFSSNRCCCLLMPHCGNMYTLENVHTFCYYIFFLFSFSNLTNTCKSCFVLTCIASDSDLLFIVLVVLGNSRGIHIYYVLHYGVMARVLTSMMSSYFLKHCGAYKTHRMIVKKCWSFVVPPNTLHIQNEDSRMTWRVGSAKISPAFARHLSSTKRLPF